MMNNIHLHCNTARDSHRWFKDRCHHLFFNNISSSIMFNCIMIHICHQAIFAVQMAVSIMSMRVDNFIKLVEPMPLKKNI